MVEVQIDWLVKSTGEAIKLGVIREVDNMWTFYPEHGIEIGEKSHLDHGLLFKTVVSWASKLYK